MSDFLLSDLHDDRADICDDVVGHANNDVTVAEEAVLERLAGRVRQQVSRETG